MKKIILNVYLFIFSSVFVINSQVPTYSDTYASLDGGIDRLLKLMTGERKNFEIKICNEYGQVIIPECYQQDRASAATQVMRETIDKEYIRPSLSHFQFIKEYIKNYPDCLPQKYILFAGGDITQWKSNLMIAKQNQKGKFFALNTITINTEIDEGDLWHPGGGDICGTFMVIPLEAYRVEKLKREIYRGKRTRVVVFDISNPENPMRVCHFDLKDDKNQPISCPAVAFTKINNRYIIACKNGYFVSSSEDINSKFEFCGKINFVNNIPKAKNLDNMQNLSFVLLDEQLYLIGTGNTSKNTPVFLGENIANVYKFNLNTSLNSTDNINAISAELVAQIWYGKEDFESPDCDFNAAATLTSHCSMLSLYHWVQSKKIKTSCCGKKSFKKFIPCCSFGPV